MIKDLMARLPLGKKAKDSNEEEDDIEEKSNSSERSGATDIDDFSDKTKIESTGSGKSLVDKLKDKVAGLGKGKNKAKVSSEESDSDEASDENDEIAKKKKKSKIIQMVIGGGLVLFLISDYIIPTEEPVPVASSFKRPNRKKIKRPQDPPATETPVVAEAAKTETPPAPETPITETTPDSDVTVTSENLPTEKTEPETTTQTPIVEETPGVVETTPETVAPAVVEATEPSSVDSIDGGETTETPGDENLTDKILQDLEKQAKKTQVPEQIKEYIAPPDYEYKGRGLVYNCTGKHWACIDAPSYKACEDNSSSVKYLKKKTECYPFNVYETAKGCDMMQNRMVSSSAKTNFCND